jgi:hypothetical protein
MNQLEDITSSPSSLFWNINITSPFLPLTTAAATAGSSHHVTA